MKCFVFRGCPDIIKTQYNHGVVAIKDERKDDDEDTDVDSDGNIDGSTGSEKIQMGFQMPKTRLDNIKINFCPHKGW